MKYEIVTANSITELVEGVNIAIGKGWHPVGGVAIYNACEAPYSNHQSVVTRLAAQAMVKDEKRTVHININDSLLDSSEFIAGVIDKINDMANTDIDISKE